MSPENSFISNGFQHHLAAKILIIDDLPLTLTVIKDILEDIGYTNLFTLSDSTQALEQIDEIRPDLIMLDLVMPKVSGFEILKALREHPKHQYIPVIILTATEENYDKLKALELGATDYLTKPVDRMELRMRVRNILFAKAYQNQLAYYDSLTQLPNKQMFLDDLEWVLKSAERHNDQIALLNVEIDNFNSINNTVGINAGDAVLRLVAARIQNVVRDSDLLMHLVDGDVDRVKLFHLERNVFSLLLDRIQGTESVAIVAKRIIREIKSTMQVEGKDYYVTASVGISIFPNEASDLQNLLRLASSAKEYVKRQGGNNFQFSSQEIHQLHENRLKLDASLRSALTNNEFLLYYQPKVDLISGQVVGAEALLRWKSDDQLIYPADFLPHAEESGLIVPLGNWCLKEACRQLKDWHDANLQIHLAVNLSAKQLSEKSFFESVRQIIFDSGVDSSYLTFELTESFLISDIDEKIKLFEKLKDLGIKLSIDDFGTGYSSLNYLRKLPVDELKIDRSFIMEITQNDHSRAIVSTIVFLAKRLNMTTVAEGVELDSERQFMQELDCNQFQGFLFSKAVPAEQFSEMLPYKH